jgi:hypothetical protein
MVLLVVELHDLPRDERLESIIGVWEIRESVSGHDGFNETVVVESREWETDRRLISSIYFSCRLFINAAYAVAHGMSLNGPLSTSYDYIYNSDIRYIINVVIHER